jgi:hypothetical protein
MKKQYLKRRPNGQGRTRREIHMAYRGRIKKAIHALLGGKCSRCGFDDERALQIDHINGGGAKDVAQKGSYQRRVLQSIMDGEKKFQLLCANCNWIKRFEKKEVRK